MSEPEAAARLEVVRDDGEDTPPPTAKIAEALAKAQAEFGVPKKSKTATVQMKDGKGSYTYNYASLDDIIDAIKKPLSKHGIAWGQPTTTRPDSISVRTVLWHTSGETLDFGEFTLSASGSPQNWGAVHTYARRYSLTSALGIPVEDDDDAVRAVGNGDTSKAGSVQDRSGKASEAQMRRLHALAKDKGVTHEQMTDWAGRHLGIASLKELTKSGASKMMESLDGLPNVEADADADVHMDDPEG